MGFSGADPIDERNRARIRELEAALACAVRALDAGATQREKARALERARAALGTNAPGYITPGAFC